MAVPFREEQEPQAAAAVDPMVPCLVMLLPEMQLRWRELRAGCDREVEVAVVVAVGWQLRVLLPEMPQH